MPALIPDYLDVLTGPEGHEVSIATAGGYITGKLVGRVVVADTLEAVILDDDGLRRVVPWGSVDHLNYESTEPKNPAAAEVPIKVGDRVRVTSTAPYGDAGSIDGKIGTVTKILDTYDFPGGGFEVTIDADQCGWWAGRADGPYVGKVERLAEPEAKPNTADAEATYDEGLDITDSDGDTLSLYAGYADDNAVEVSAKQDGRDAAIIYISDDDLPKVIAYLQAAQVARGAA